MNRFVNRVHDACDGVDDAGNELRGEVVAHSLEFQQRCAGNGPRHLASCGPGDERIVRAVDDEGGHADRRQFRAPVSGSEHREHLPRDAIRGVATPGRFRALRPELCGIRRIRRAADHVHHVHQVVGHRVDVVRLLRAMQDGAQRPRPRHRGERVAASGHDRGEAQDPVGPACRQHLRHHAAERCAHHVRLADLQRIEEADHVLRHVRERVGRLHRDAHDGARHGDGDRRVRSFLHALRQTAIAIVQAHHVVAGLHQPVDERVGPEDEGHSQSHHQHHGCGAGAAARLVGDRDPVRLQRGHRLP